MTIELSPEAAQHLKSELGPRILRIAFTTGCGGSGYRLSFADAPLDADDPMSVDGVRVALADWNGRASKGTVTCSAEQISPGEHVIAIRVNAPAQPATLVNRVHVTSLGSSDPQPSNDDAARSVTVYDPARCTAAAPILLSP